MLKKILSIVIFCFVATIADANAAYVHYRCKGDTGWASHGADDIYDAMVEAMAIASSICGDAGYEVARSAVGSAGIVPSISVLNPAAVKPVTSKPLSGLIKGAPLPVQRPGGSGLPIYKISPLPTKGSTLPPR